MNLMDVSQMLGNFGEFVVYTLLLLGVLLGQVRCEGAIVGSLYTDRRRFGHSGS